MIDTIKVFTDDFRVQDNAQITIQPGTIDYEENASKEGRLFMNSAREWVTGAKAYINTDRYNLTIKPNTIGEGTKAFIQFSLPKALTGDNYNPIQESEIHQAKRLIAQDLSDRGVLMNLEECKVSRIDTFRNAATEEPYLDYAPLFRLLKAQRQQRRDYGSTFLWSNTQREICVYDKNEEVRLRGGVSRLPTPPNTIRFEYRLLNTRVTRTDTGIDRLKDITSFEAVKETYKMALKKHLFNQEVSDTDILSATNLEAILENYRDEQGRYWVDQFLRDYGAYTVLSKTDPETLKIILEVVAGNRQTAWRVTKGMEEQHAKMKMMTPATGNKTLADLYQELEEKVLNDLE